MNRDDDDELSALIRRDATRHAAPDRLRAAIRTQVALADAGRRRFDFRWRTAAVSFALGLAGALLVPPLLRGLGHDEPLEAELVADHVRALGAGPLIQVASSDRHTVKPWYQGRLDYAPPVFDLAADGFPLLGGRVERVQGAAVAALAYQRQRHVIELFVWPAQAPQAPVQRVHRGFNLLHWSDGAMQYWAVSDVEPGELQQFARRWQAQAAAP